jgi:prepilin-type N-terminal cleavage/methylation domain-containing protein
MISRSRRLGGFTLIEIMIVVAILAILTLIALPKFGNMIRKANEAGTKGHLGSVRGAIRLYYMDNDQVFPPTFSALRQVGGKYLSGTIMLYTGIHPTVDTVDEVLVLTPTSDAGHWAYVSGGADLGFFWIQCTHEDLTFTPWSRY